MQCLANQCDNNCHGSCHASRHTQFLEFSFYVLGHSRLLPVLTLRIKPMPRIKTPTSPINSVSINGPSAPALFSY